MIATVACANEMRALSVPYTGVRVANECARLDRQGKKPPHVLMWLLVLQMLCAPREVPGGCLGVSKAQRAPFWAKRVSLHCSEQDE